MPQTAPPEAVTIRYAETMDDVNAIHQFLLVVARGAMRCPVDPLQSIQEIIRVTQEQVALMAINSESRLVGTLGIVSSAWWYNPEYSFMCDRWHFVLPKYQHTDVDRMLLDEADSIAEAAGLEFIDFGKIRVRKRHGKRPKLMMFPRSPLSESDKVTERRA